MSRQEQMITLGMEIRALCGWLIIPRDRVTERLVTLAALLRDEVLIKGDIDITHKEGIPGYALTLSRPARIGPDLNASTMLAEEDLNTHANVPPHVEVVRRLLSLDGILSKEERRI